MVRQPNTNKTIFLSWSRMVHLQVPPAGSGGVEGGHAKHLDFKLFAGAGDR